MRESQNSKSAKAKKSKAKSNVECGSTSKTKKGE